MTKTSAPVVLLTTTCWWHSVPRLALSLARAGCSVAALYPPRGHPLETLTAVEKRFPYSAKNSIAALRHAITTARPDIIVPCDDRAVMHLQQLHALESAGWPSNGPSQESLVLLIERSIGDSKAFAITRGRYPLISLAREMGLAAPWTAELNSDDDVDEWLSDHGFPTVFKVDGSWGGNGVCIVGSDTEAHQVYHRLSRHCPMWRALKRRVVNRDPYWISESRRRLAGAVSAQTYIDGYPANCAVFCWQGRVLGGISVEVLRTRTARAPATLVRVVERPEMLKAAELLAQRLKLSGFIGLDFMIDRATNTAHLIEMNARPTPLCHLRLGVGRDLVGAMTATLSGRPLSAVLDTTSDVIAYFPFAAQGDPSEIPTGTYHDIPVGAPDLVKELLRRPWPNRSLLARPFYWLMGALDAGRHLVARCLARPGRSKIVSEGLTQSRAPAMANIKGECR